MAHVKISWQAGDQSFPFGTVADHFMVSLGGGVPDVTVPPEALEADFPDVPPGDYTASVQLVAPDGSNLGDPATSGMFNVHPDVTMLHVAVGVQ